MLHVTHVIYKVIGSPNKVSLDGHVHASLTYVSLNFPALTCSSSSFSTMEFSIANPTEYASVPIEHRFEPYDDNGG